MGLIQFLERKESNKTLTSGQPRRGERKDCNTDLKLPPYKDSNQDTFLHMTGLRGSDWCVGEMMIAIMFAGEVRDDLQVPY